MCVCVCMVVVKEQEVQKKNCKMDDDGLELLSLVVLVYSCVEYTCVSVTDC